MDNWSVCLALLRQSYAMQFRKHLKRKLEGRAREEQGRGSKAKRRKKAGFGGGGGGGKGTNKGKKKTFGKKQIKGGKRR